VAACGIVAIRIAIVSRCDGIDDRRFSGPAIDVEDRVHERGAYGRADVADCRQPIWSATASASL
jgi:hypothetical protein